MASRFYTKAYTTKAWVEAACANPITSPFEDLGQPTQPIPSKDLLSKNLIVNYLPQSFTDRNLFGLFVPFGPIHSVKIMKEAKVRPQKMK
jgi:hypothetical protein